MTNKSEDNNGVNDRSSTEVNRAIEGLLQRSTRIKISGLKGQDNVAIGLKGNSEIDINGDAGRYIGSFNMGPVIVLKGNCGDLAADNLINGGLIIMGNCGEKCGISMVGGIVVIKGNSGADLGVNNLNGTIIADGDVNGDTGHSMKGGRIIVTGDINGNLGRSSTGGTFYVAGNVEKISEGIISRKMNQKDYERLKRYFDHYGIEAFPKAFRKYATSKVD